MSALAEVYASAPAGSLIIPALMVERPGAATIRICCGFEDQLLGLNGSFHLFEAGSLEVMLPNKTTNGTQTLGFGVSNVNGIVQRYVDEALESGSPVTITYLEYLESDKSQPARKPYVMDLKGGTFDGPGVVMQAGYYTLLDTAWPRERYTAQNAPGIKYL